MKRILFGVGVLMILGLVLTASAVTPTNLILDYSMTGVDASLKPGDSGILTVVIQNTGGYQAENVQVSIPDSGDVHAAKLWQVGNIEAGGSKIVTTAVNVDENAKVGLHTLQARIYYDGTNIDGDKKTNQIVSWDIPIRIYGNANFKYTLVPAEYGQDTEGTLTINLKPMVMVRKVTSKVSSGCASIVGSDKQYMGDMSAEVEYPVTYIIKPSQVGACSLSMYLEYSDASGTQTSENASIGINVERSNTDLKIVDIADGSLALGGVSNITLMIKNLGNSMAKDVTATLSLSSPFTPVKSSESYVGSISPGQTAGASFTISVDSSAKKKSYSIPVTLEYYDQAGAKQTASVNIGLNVGGSADIKVNLDSKESMIAGSGGKVTIGVVNRGFVDAKFLTMRLLSTDNYQVTSADSTYIGALNSDDSDSQDFEIKVASNVTENAIPLVVRVEYKEENNDRLIVKEETIDLSLLSAADYKEGQSGSGIISLLLGVIGVVIALIAAYLGIWFLARVLGVLTNTLDRKIFKRDQEED